MTRFVEHQWAIVSGHGGIYHFSNSDTRAAAIALHVHFKCLAHEEQPSQFTSNGKLDPLQRERWRRARKNGDRAVRITITWTEAPR